MKLLYLCTHNACRSIIGEAVTGALAGDRFQVASAGASPAGQVHPLTMEYLGLHGYRTEGLYSKSIDEVSSFEPDIVITVCDNAARESCPIWLQSASKIHWGFPDPSRADIANKAEAFASLIAEIEARTKSLLEQPVESMNEAQRLAIFNRIGGRTDGDI